VNLLRSFCNSNTSTPSVPKRILRVKSVAPKEIAGEKTKIETSRKRGRKIYFFIEI
jgi:hypothetical protein